MSTLVDKYNNLKKSVSALRDKITATERKIEQLKTERTGDIPVRIAKLEDQLLKIEEYLPKIQQFKELAKQHLESQNVLTIDAPPGYRVNLNRLRSWAMKIAPDSSNDPYAQRVFVVASCDECFLERKKAEFTERIKQLQSDESTGLTKEITRLEEELLTLRGQLRSIASSKETAEFFKEAIKENKKYWYADRMPTEYKNPKASPACLAPGAYAAPLPFESGQRDILSGQYGDFYDSESSRVLLPVEMPFDKEFIMMVRCSPACAKKLDSGLQNMILQMIDNSAAGERFIQVLDATRYNSSSMGRLRLLEESFAMGKIPRNREQMTETVEKMVAALSDTDDMLGLCDSVAEYNKTAKPKDRLPYTTLVLYGWPNAFEASERELIGRIISNYERYGISVIAINYSINKDENDKDDSGIPEYARYNAVKVRMLPKDTTISFLDQSPQRFFWYSVTGELTEAYAESVKSCKPVKEKTGNEYTKRHSMTELPAYVREYKNIELPFGIDGKDKERTITFENENFAAYLMGASRSGKSTLLHTLIAGLIREYHPDNLELWLADFKQVEFKRYMKHCPPHVKYVLLDESTELVFDLIDRLTAVMLDRQKLFAREGYQRLDVLVKNVKLSEPLPVIFVILDEFSIMSQSIAEYPEYKLKLQNILAKGGALGIKLIFSSQTFNTGVAGLTPTARAQIQQRIAMKGTKDDITGTLELSANLKTEKVLNWIDALPPHYALVKYRGSDADQTPEVERVLCMYFSDYDDRDAMIERINDKMRKVDQYTPGDIATYVDKHPVFVDGNSYDNYDEQVFIRHVNATKSEDADEAGDKILSFGTPRLMTHMKQTRLSAETRENLMLVARGVEQTCAASIMLSSAKEYIAQGGIVEMWAYGRNRVLKKHRSQFESIGVNIIENIDAVCDAIRSLKQDIQERKHSDKLILLAGIERICMDFSFVDGIDKSNPGETSEYMRQRELALETAGVSTDEEALKAKFARSWMSKKKEYEKKFMEEGKSSEEIKTLLTQLRQQFREEFYATNSAGTEFAEKKAEEKNQTVTEEEQKGAYNAADDFRYVVMQGSRLGYHFFLYLNDLSDLKVTNLKSDYFRHRMAFQLSVDDSRTLFSSRIASSLPSHICQFDDGFEKYSFRPYLHEGVSWDGWFVTADNKVISPYEQDE
ncbi:MAG: hypothetical protein IJZ51_09310 [Ruminiclostridium sp.]|nr:hypothetical protein [Ruminiclostridium sp.]